MSTILESLKLYFQSNSREQIERDWAESEQYDIIGPKIDEFIHQSKQFNLIETTDSYWKYSCSKQIIKNPEFASDFFLV
ncbi:MAG: hypothetical protein JEZ09_20505 [Salinivirgaceae bacterium]|nr:hypothetical protein [Salinivirgaceae bacterium]